VKGVTPEANGAEPPLPLLVRRGSARADSECLLLTPRFVCGKLLGDTAAVTALLDRLLHHAHVLKCGPLSWCTKIQTDLRTEETTR
jgi:hypothetical protein